MGDNFTITCIGSDSYDVRAWMNAVDSAGEYRFSTAKGLVEYGLLYAAERNTVQTHWEVDGLGLYFCWRLANVPTIEQINHVAALGQMLVTDEIDKAIKLRQRLQALGLMDTLNELSEDIKVLRGEVAALKYWRVLLEGKGEKG